jgi:AcrR family transcriptional regulator
MRYDAEHKAKTRERVLKEAAKAIREDGPDRIAVAGIMAKAGLTHGGFYAHFKSKDELVAAAIGEMFKDASTRFAKSTEGYSPNAGMVRYIDFYLSEDHRDRRATGCPVTALAADCTGSDTARASDRAPTSSATSDGATAPASAWPMATSCPASLSVRPLTPWP